MTHGGKRNGAGRKAGVPSKLTAEVQAAIAETGETPRDYMLRMMRDETVDHARRDAMAKAVAPYCHPHLTAVAVTDETPRADMTEEELIKAIEERANRLGVKIDFSHSTISRAVKRSGQGPSCQDRSPPYKEKHASGSSGDLLPPSPPAEKAAAVAASRVAA
jgi:hypothetical protein